MLTWWPKSPCLHATTQCRPLVAAMALAAMVAVQVAVMVAAETAEFSAYKWHQCKAVGQRAGGPHGRMSAHSVQT